MKKEDLKSIRLILFLGGIITCAIVTGIYVHSLCRTYSERVVTWNEQAQTAFLKALDLEMDKRKNISVLFISCDSNKYRTLETPYQSPICIKSEYGTCYYDIPRVKYENGYIRDTDKRKILSYILEIYPLSVDTLRMSWDSLLTSQSIKANTGIRIATTDLLERTFAVYSPDSTNVQQGDSLFSRYIGFRYETEITGTTSYNWWQILNIGPFIITMFLLWFCFLPLCLCYERIVSLFQLRFMRKKISKKKKKIYLGEVIEETGLYKLVDGTIFDSSSYVLSREEKTVTLPPQTVNLLKLFLQKEGDYWLTTEEIIQEIWGKRGNQNQLHAAIHRLREALKKVSSRILVIHEDGKYCLKMSHSIDENPNFL